jgi:hypothetical protein
MTAETDVQLGNHRLPFSGKWSRNFLQRSMDGIWLEPLTVNGAEFRIVDPNGRFADTAGQFLTSLPIFLMAR